MTPGGFVVNMDPIANFPTVDIRFSGANCTGSAAVMLQYDPIYSGVLRTHMYAVGGAFYAHDGDLAKPLTQNDKVSFSMASGTSGTSPCSNPAYGTPSAQPMYPVHKLTLDQIGWAAMPVPPLTIVP